MKKIEAETGTTYRYVVPVSASIFFLSLLAAGVGHGLKMVWPNFAALLFISLHFKPKRHRVIHFLEVDVVKDRIDILIDLWFGIPSFFNTFPSVYQAKVFQEFALTFQIL